jgi:hypothetical protein
MHALLVGILLLESARLPYLMTPAARCSTSRPPRGCSLVSGARLREPVATSSCLSTFCGCRLAAAAAAPRSWLPPQRTRPTPPPGKPPFPSKANRCVRILIPLCVLFCLLRSHLRMEINSVVVVAMMTAQICWNFFDFLQQFVQVLDGFNPRYPRLCLLWTNK